MDKYFEKIGVTAALTIYLFICGSLYTFFYWSKFNFDIANLITIADIPKSIFTAVFIALSLIVFITVIGSNSGKLVKKSRILDIFIRAIVTIGSVFAIIFLNYLNNAFAVLVFLGEVFCFVKFNYIKALVLYDKQIIINYLFFIAIFCSVIGYFSADSILRNSSRTNYTLQVQSSDTTLINLCKNKKLLGYIGDKIILSDINNSNFIVVDQNNLSAIVFTTDSSLLTRK